MPSLKKYKPEKHKKTKQNKQGGPKHISQEKTARVEFSFTGRTQKTPSPLNNPVWRSLLAVSGGCIGIWLVIVLFGFDRMVPVWVAALLGLVVWGCAVWMLLLDSRLKIFWIVWLVGGFCLLMFTGARGLIWIGAAAFSFVFLLFRRYKPYRHLSSRRRAGIFLLGLLTLGLLTIGFLPEKIEVAAESIPAVEPVPPDVQTDIPVEVGTNLARYALTSLRMFWIFSLFHLFFSIRLHFMKLRPKLAVSAFLLVLVPLFLVTVMGLLTLYAALGESRAIRAGNVLSDWAEFAVKDEGFVHVVSGGSFVYNPGVARKEQVTPAWLSEFVEAVKKQDFTFADWNTNLEAAYFWIGSEVWLMSLEGAGTPDVIIRACLLDSAMMNRLAAVLHCNVRLTFSDPINLGVVGNVNIKGIPKDAESPQKDIVGIYLPEPPLRTASPDFSLSIWKRPLYFGMTDIPMISYASDTPGKFVRQNVLLLLEGSISHIFGELSSERNPLSLVVFILLLSLSVVLMILEIFALFFGLRITMGFTSAVQELHRGTRRLAGGDLDARIEIPNEDELGDLAASFNEMTAAVRKGQEAAIAQERLESELKTARKIQERLLPHEMPDIPGFEIAGTSLPSQQVGGDYFDFLDMGKGHLGIAIADVSGKGIPAALLMANLQASLHAQVVKPGDVAEVTSRINNLLVKSTDSNMFATFFYGILDRMSSSFTSTNAGHNPPILLHADEKVERLGEGGMILGFMAGQPYSQQTACLEPGDVLVLFTDGITEAVDMSLENVAENLFGDERLMSVIRKNRAGTAREMQSAILKEISEHTGDSPQSDDITLVVIKRQG